ncbi:hypothetical protein [Croceimicrobium sp.]|uniref:hypothetical protein n=1 Tax=Croceimicrobium sp. TaxID=2828340 RepID=UPI003BAC0C7B
MANKVFKEKQQYLSIKSKWIVSSILLLLCIVLLRLYLSPSIKFQAMDLLPGAIAVVLCLALIWFLSHLRLKTSISKKGIEYKMMPFHHSKRIIHWDEISFIRIVSFPRLSSWQKSYNHYLLQKKFTFSGRNGMSVETSWGERIFIGSGKVDELRKAIKKAVKHYKLLEENKTDLH